MIYAEVDTTMPRGRRLRRHAVNVGAMTEQDQLNLALLRSMEDDELSNRKGDLDRHKLTNYGAYIDMVGKMFPIVATIDRECAIKILSFLALCATDDMGYRHILPLIQSNMAIYMANHRAVRYVARQFGVNLSPDAANALFVMHNAEHFEVDAENYIITFHLPMANAIAYTHCMRRLGRDLTGNIYKFIRETSDTKPCVELRNAISSFADMTSADHQAFKWLTTLSLYDAPTWDSHKNRHNKMLQTLSKMYVQDIMDITKESYPGLGKLLTKVSSDDGHISMNMLMRLAHKWPVHKIFVTLRDPMAVFGIGAIRVAKFTPQVADEDQGRDKYKKTERSTYGEPVAVTQWGVISPRS